MTKCPACGHDPQRTSKRTYHAKLAREGLPLPEPESKRRGLSIPGVRGAAPRYLERDAKIAALVAAGRSVSEAAEVLGITFYAARGGLAAHRERQRKVAR